MLLTLFSFSTPQLSQASLKSFLRVLCMVHSAAAASEDGFEAGNVQRFQTEDLKDGQMGFNAKSVWQSAEPLLCVTLCSRSAAYRARVSLCFNM